MKEAPPRPRVSPSAPRALGCRRASASLSVLRVSSVTFICAVVRAVFCSVRGSRTRSCCTAGGCKDAAAALTQP